jgi:hypothetical protein
MDMTFIIGYNPDNITLKSLCTCVSCESKIRSMYKSEASEYREYDWNNIIKNSYDVDNVEGHVYDYKCASCVSDREYGARYNRLHPIKEFI